MAKSKSSKSNENFKETEHIKRNLPSPKSPNEEVGHNANKESLGENTKR